MSMPCSNLRINPFRQVSFWFHRNDYSTAQYKNMVERYAHTLRKKGEFKRNIVMVVLLLY